MAAAQTQKPSRHPGRPGQGFSKAAESAVAQNVPESPLCKTKEPESEPRTQFGSDESIATTDRGDTLWSPARRFSNCARGEGAGGAGLSSLVRSYTGASNFQELFELADKTSFDSTMRSGYAECAVCQQCFSKTAQMDGRAEVRVLPCFHSICGPCLQNVLLECSGDNLTCPVCSRLCKKMALQSFLPHFDVHAMRDNERAAQLDLMCEECMVADIAESFCDICLLSLCSRCTRQHRRSKLSAQHELRPIHRMEEASEPTKLSRPIQCAVHRSMHNDLFCEDCQTLICRQCALEAHQDHAYKLPTTSMVERHRREIQEFLDHMGSRIANAQVLQKGLHQQMLDLDVECGRYAGDVKCVFDGLLTEVNRWQANARRRLDLEGSPLGEALLLRRREYAKALVDICRKMDFLEKVCTHGSGIELLEVQSRMRNDHYQLRTQQHWNDLCATPLADLHIPHAIEAGWRSEDERATLLNLVASVGVVQMHGD
eukprot:TRINITY_DN23652_c0_g1_i1.p1 TRINITY_DN23652_c0_g1~~TRINITY_DN23652_c0_g1_i1.p1  ORF type:complete len:486 (+),score=107.36 TRINITY_DN23652_c0_g1_i1:120-1577(+)